MHGLFVKIEMKTDMNSQKELFGGLQYGHMWANIGGQNASLVSILNGLTRAQIFQWSGLLMTVGHKRTAMNIMGMI